VPGVKIIDPSRRVVMVRPRPASRRGPQGEFFSGATSLTDVKVKERWYYAYIGDVFCTDIEGVGYTAR